MENDLEIKIQVDKLNNQESNKKKILMLIVGIVLISLIFELFVYNFNYWKTVHNTPADNMVITYDSGIHIVDNGHWILNSEQNSVCVEITEINMPVSYLLFDASWAESQYADKDVRFRIYAKDEGNEVYLQLPDRYVNRLFEESKYTQLHLAGKVSSLKIEIFINGWNREEGELELDVSSLVVNPRRSFDFSPKRFVILLIVFGMLVALLPNVGLWNKAFDKKNKIQLAVTVLIILFEIGLAFIMVNKVEYPDYNGPYTKMARALAKGQVYLDDEVSPSLLELDNPYDTGLRNEKDVDYMWDYAYYNGRYYVYFGVVPDILLFLPYLLLTGKDYLGYADNLIPITGVLVGIALLVRLICQKYYPKISFVLSQVLTVAVSFGSYIYITATHPDYYSVPRSWSLCFLAWGLYFWIASVGEEKLTRWKLVAGSLCMALIAGCRPQLLLGMALAIPIFGEYIKMKCKASDKHTKKRIAADFVFFSIPIVLIAVLLMYYNYLRFGSVFDFGANYNLTSNDMTKRGFSPARIPAGIYTYLLQLPNITMSFPFIRKVAFPDTVYQGVNIITQTAGGFLTTNLIACFGFFAFTGKVKGKAKSISLISLLSVLIIVVADTMMAGILPYYYTDFAFFGMLAMLFVVAELEKNTEAHRADLYMIVMILTILVVLFHLGCMIGLTNIQNGAPKLYNLARELTQPFNW